MADNKKKVILIGAGNRGMTYVGLMKMNGMEENYQVIGVAEPVVSRRNSVKDYPIKIVIVYVTA